MSGLNSTALHFVSSEDNQLVAATFGVAALFAAAAVYYSLSSKDNEHEFPRLPGIQLYHAWNFFQWRHDFLHSNYQRHPGKGFSFNVLQHKVIALTGEDARRILYSDHRLDFSEGVKILKGMAPSPHSLRYVEPDTNGEWNTPRFNKALNKLLTKPRIESALPTLLHDIISKADKWGNSGRIDPFVEIYDLVFLMTTHMASCRDLAKNETDLKQLRELFLTLMTTSTPTALLFPWFPSPGRVKTTMANVKMFFILRRYIEARRDEVPTSDAIDVLISDGETTQDIVQFVATFLFSGIGNTGIASCWTLIDLATRPEWRDKCREEIRDVLSRHSCDSDSSATLYDKLSAIPSSAWEGELPTLDACSRESLRISLTGLSLRRNVREDMSIGGKVVKRGDFLAYPMSEVHLNPEYYPEPDKYDPGRWLRPDPVPEAVYPFLGWGAGRHACIGSKVARLEMKLITAMFLMRYEYELVGEDGKLPDPLPVPNKNNSKNRPPGPMFYFKFNKVME